MIERKGRRIILSGDESIQFVRKALYMDSDMSRTHEAHHKKIDKIAITPIENGFVADFPELTIPDEVDKYELKYTGYTASRNPCVENGVHSRGCFGETKSLMCRTVTIPENEIKINYTAHEEKCELRPQSPNCLAA